MPYPMKPGERLYVVRYEGGIILRPTLDDARRRFAELPIGFSAHWYVIAHDLCQAGRLDVSEIGVDGVGSVTQPSPEVAAFVRKAAGAVAVDEKGWAISCA